MSRTLTFDTLLHALGGRGDSQQTSLAIRASAVCFMTLLTAAAAQVSFSIPLTPVPLTMQPMVVLMAGLVLGPQLGMMSQVLYLASGFAGLPVFAVSPTLPMGVARLLGPTGGYLMAYPLAAFVTGALARRGFDRRYLTTVAAMVAGLLVIYACGVLWLGFFARGTTPSVPSGIAGALAAGVYPFLIADLLKVLAAGGTTPALWRLLGRT